MRKNLPQHNQQPPITSAPRFDIGDGTELAAAWDDLRSALFDNPQWTLKGGFYIPNGGGWGCHLDNDLGTGVDVWIRQGTPADAFKRAARYVRGEFVRYVNDYDPTLTIEEMTLYAAQRETFRRAIANGWQWHEPSVLGTHTANRDLASATAYLDKLPVAVETETT